MCNNEELYHHGVKGMKWGVRRQQRRAAKDRYRRSTNKAFEDYERTIADIERPYKRGQTLSDKDLSRQADAERKFSDAVSKAKLDYKTSLSNIKNSTTTSNGKTVAGKILKGAAKTAGVAAIAGATTVTIGYAVVNKFYNEHLA